MEDEMNVTLKRSAAILPLLALASLALAAPVALNAPEMDRVTAGAQPILERLAGMLSTANASALGADQIALIMQLASSEPVTFQRESSGDLVATQQLRSGDQLVLVKQLSTAEDAALPQQAQSNAVTTRLLQPGEQLSIQQTTINGSSYLYIRSSGPSTVTTTRSF